MPHDAASAKDAGRAARDASRRRLPRLSRASLIALGLGAVTVAGFAPLYLYPLPVMTLAVLMWMWGRADSPKGAAELGWWFGLGMFLTGVSWVYVSLHTFGAMPAPLAAFFTLLFCAFLALFPAAAGWCFHAIRAPAWMKLALVAPAAWTLAEWTRGWIFTGFPWLTAGYSQIPLSPLAGYAPILGVYGVSWLTLSSAGLLVAIAQHVRSPAPGHEAGTTSRERIRAAALIAIVIAIGLGGYALKQVRWTTPEGEPVKVTLLQGNIPQEIKWTAEGLRSTLIRYRELALASDSRLIVFPETAIPLFLRDIPPDYLGDIADHARRNRGDALLGVPELLPEGNYYNSVVSLGTSPTQTYRKSHLVPFGEFIPLRPVLGWLVSVLAIPLQDFSRGSLDQKPLEIAGQRVAVNVCYEDAFGEDIVRQLPAATMLVNVSNVAWFGRSVAPYQHLQISQARALETGRYMMRATNTGMTGVVDERGNAVQIAPEFSTATVTAMVQGYTGSTPYVRVGNSAAIALCLAMLAVGMLYARVTSRLPSDPNSPGL